MAFVLALASAAAVACSALLGVEDVRELRRDGAAPLDDSGEDPDADPSTDAAAFPEASVQLALGFNHSCARKLDGKVHCWGENGGGQLGDGISFEAGPRTPALVPQEVPGITDAIQVASGVSHSCVLKRGGTVVCWGVNTFGQLGDATTTRSSSPVDVIGVTTAVAIACGTSFTCALLADATVACWGANYAGQLGDGTKISRPTAAAVSQLAGATAIATAESHSCAIVAGGAVKCWGKNSEGQLGNGSINESLLPTSLDSLAGAVQIVAASRFTCARLGSGQVNCWGANTLGQLGTGSPNTAPNPSPAITNVSDAISIWVGYEHACAVRRTGSVVCWGAAGSGQVGSGSVPEDASIPRPTAVVGVSDALDLSTGGYHSCATTRSGAVLCWGTNSLGQLGNGTTQRAYAAVPVSKFP
jgi:alpha-tubulin suppressor-like RCC1 family protein